LFLANELKDVRIQISFQSHLQALRCIAVHSTVGVLMQIIIMTS